METYIDQHGYERYRETDLLVHREVYAEKFGNIAHRWIVHHVDGNKRNNDPENLISLHWRVHDLIHQVFPKGQLPKKNEIILWLRVIARFSPKVAKGLEAQGSPRKTKAKKRKGKVRPRVVLRKAISKALEMPT